MTLYYLDEGLRKLRAVEAQDRYNSAIAYAFATPCPLLSLRSSYNTWRYRVGWCDGP